MYCSAQPNYAYLGSPYSHPDKIIRELRYHAALHHTVMMLRQKIWVHAPIVHCHAMSVSGELPSDFAFWSNYNKTMLGRAGTLYVLQLPLWEESEGLLGEVRYAKERDIHTFWVHPTKENPYAEVLRKLAE